MINKTTAYVAGGTGKVGKVLVNGLKDSGMQVLTGSRYEALGDYVVGELDNVANNSIGIISTTHEGVEGALNDFQLDSQMPVIITTTAFNEQLLSKLENPVLNAPNLSIPIVSIFEKFENFSNFSGMKLEMQESHQLGKKDPSGTAMKVINMFTQKGGECDVDATLYESEGKSDLGDMVCYRGESSKDLGVPDSFLGGHGYHSYVISGEGENFEEFSKIIQSWFEAYKDVDMQGLNIKFNKQEGKIIFSHNIDGREIYSDGLIELLPWFLQQPGGVHQVADYLNK